MVNGPEDVTLPFTGLTLQGLEVEPSVITDYRGFTALAYHPCWAGSATAPSSPRRGGPWPGGGRRARRRGA